MFVTYAWLLVAIIFEVMATAMMKETEGFTRLLPTVIALFCYGVSFYFLAQTLKVMPVGIVYAIWSGTGVVLIALIGWVLFRQALDLPAMIGIALIIAGVAVINLFSKSVPH